MRPTRAEIDLAAIRHNIRQIRAKIGPAVKILAILKADAYGHGSIKVSQTVVKAGADCLAVAIPEEGAGLRAAGIKVPIFVLGLTLPEQNRLLVEHDLIATIASAENMQVLEAAANSYGKQTKMVIKVDTGMGRIGVTPEQLADLLQQVKDSPHLELVGIFTHLAAADAADKTYSINQLNKFKALITDLNLPYISAGNSATIIDLPEGHFSAVRPGIIMYGLPPSHEMHTSLDLIPAMQFKTKVIYIKQVPAGSYISYGCTYQTSQPTYIATLPVGYADGYSRLLSNKADVLIGGKRRPIIGRVCMDQLMVDLGPVCDAAVGDEAVLFGRQGEAEITATELADMIGTINYEMLCALSPRVPRVYLNEE